MFFTRGKTLKLIVIIALVVAFVLTGILVLSRTKKDKSYDPILVEAGKGLSNYDIYVKFDPDAAVLSCDQRVEYVNTSEDELTHLYFHLYPNAFQYEERSVFPEDDMGKAYPNGFHPGYLRLKSLSVNGTDNEYTVGGYSEDLLMIILNDVLCPGDSLVIDMTYDVGLPNCTGRFGYGDSTYKVANWYPIACVYDERGWNLDRYYAIGDPFYSDLANYKVVIEAPEGYTIASTGDLKESNLMDQEVRLDIGARAVRDFAWIASDRFELLSTKVGDTTINSYFYSENGHKALNYASVALELFNKAFGQYPYNQFSVVEADFYIGGMEYPNLIMIDESLYADRNHDYLELVIAHETAHQWWYGLVGNNQIMDAWIDEGLTEYSTVLYYGLRYGSEREMQVYRDEIGLGKYYYILQLSAFTSNIDETIHKPIYEFSDWLIYDVLVYGKASVMFHGIRERIGDEMFFKAIREFYDEYSFSNVNKDDIIGSFNRSTDLNWGPYFDEWLYN